MASDQGSSGIHIVDHDGSFGSTPAEINQFLSGHKVQANNYSLVAILGCQSTGKSTLLNMLFGTQFAMMDKSRGRSQTTRGIWMDCSVRVPDIVVLDLEGTDSGERGEDRGSFERQTGLYGLALAEVLIINMWYHDIGRYTASNYGILKTVFEVNLKLFGAKSKTTILFLIRDHEADTPLQSLRDKILVEMETIWAEIAKPENLKSTKIGELFTFDFHALPHLKHEAALFQERVDDLRLWFADANHQRYLLGRPGCAEFRAKSVPANGFGQYAQQVWTTIREQKELNLPSQREMLAAFRCDEFIMATMHSFHEQHAQRLASAAKSALVSDFGTQAKQVVSSTLTAFEESTAGYEIHIVARKREELLHKMLESLHSAHAANLQQAVRRAVAAFEQSIAAEITSDKVCNKFNTIVAELRTKAVESFEAVVKESTLPEATASNLWSHSQESDELTQRIDSAVSARRKDQLVLLVDSMKKQITEVELPKQVAIVFTHYPEDMWSRIRDAFAKLISSTREKLDAALADYTVSESEKQSLMDSLRSHARAQLLSAQKTQATTVALKMKHKFMQAFLNDENHLPRRWRRNDQPRPVFVKAREVGMKVIDLFEKFQLEEKSDEPDVISPMERAEMVSAFERETDRELEQVEWKQAKMNENNLPWWVFIVFLVLGWDEVVYVLTNPLLLLMTIAGIAYVLTTYADAVEESPFGFLVSSGVKQALNTARRQMLGASNSTSSSPSSSTSPSESSQKSIKSKKAD